MDLRGEMMPAPKTKNNKPALKFTIDSWDAENEGERIIIFGDGGMGKNTLASLAPNSIFLPLSDGGKRIRSALTGKKCSPVKGIETFADLMELLDDPNFFKPNQIPVLDDLSTLEAWIESHIIENYTVKGKKASSFREFGWDGAGHIVFELRKMQTRIDRLIQKGITFVFLSHRQIVNMANADQDFIISTLKLRHQRNDSPLETMFHWADHVVEIEFNDKEYNYEKRGPKTLTKVTGKERVIFTEREANHLRKSRMFGENGESLPPIISFDNPGDASFWAFLYPDKYEYDEKNEMWSFKE